MRILIADDHGIVRGGLRLLIDRQPDMQVVAEAADGVEAFEQALATRPDLCVLDVSMPRMTGLQATRQIRAHLPETQVLALSMHDDERYVFDALKAGASGYVLKREVDQALLNDEEQLVLYRVTQESLSNVAQHSGAARVDVELSSVGRTILRVRDDGRGFSSIPRANGRAHLGLSGMRERALLVGGRLNVYSEPGEGTTIELTMEGR